MFAVLPQVFEKMPAGDFIGAAFFVMVFFAALTSSISLMETVVSIVQDKFNRLTRRRCCLVVVGISALLGVFSALGYSKWSDFTLLGMQILDFFDFISNSVIMPLVALLTCIFVGYILKPKAIFEELEVNGRVGGKWFLSGMIRYVAPVCLVIILVSSVLSAFGILKI